MIVVQQMNDGSYQEIDGNPVIDRLDGEARAPLLTILAESWTPKERAEYGIYIANQHPVPEGQRIVSYCFAMDEDGVVWQNCEYEDIPKPPEKTIADKLAYLGIDPVELKAYLASI